MVHEDPLLSAIFKNHLSNDHCGRWPDCGHLEAHVQQRCRGHYLRPFYLSERGSKPGDCCRRRTLQHICWQVHQQLRGRNLATARDRHYISPIKSTLTNRYAVLVFATSCSPKVSMACSRRTNFCTLPLAVMG